MTRQLEEQQFSEQMLEAQRALFFIYALQHTRDSNFQRIEIHYLLRDKRLEFYNTLKLCTNN
jgi:hypothetical protein